MAQVTYCKFCGAYIPKGQKKCLACGSIVDFPSLDGNPYSVETTSLEKCRALLFELQLKEHVDDVKKETRMKKIPLDRDFEQMLISSERYACGRMSYIVGTTVDYVLSLLPHLSDWCIGVMQNDMKSEFEMYDRAPDLKNLGMDCDYRQWVRFREALDAEMESRKK